MKTLKEKIEVMQAALDGKPIQWRDLYAYEDYDWRDTKDTQWAWHVNDYRVKPQPPAKKLVAMQPEDYPPVFWVRVKKFPDKHMLCTEVFGGWLRFSGNLLGLNNETTVHELSGLNVANPRPCEYSVDRKVWLPCVKEVDA